MRKSAAALCMAVILCLSLLAGCGNTPAAGGGQVFVENEAEGQDEQVLKFFAPTDNDSSMARYYKEMIDRYNEGHSGLRVTLEGISTADGFNEYLEQRLDAGEGDDVFILNADSVKPLHAKGYLYDLSGLPVFEKLNDATKDQAMIGDIAYCIPVNMSAYVMFVNVDLLEQYGLEPPQNLEEFINCCRTVKAGGGTPLSLNRWYALTVPAMANGLYQIYSAENSKELLAGLNSGEVKIGDYMLEGFELFQTAVEEGWYGDGLDGAAVNALKAGDTDYPDFAAGKTAFYFVTVGNIKRMDSKYPEINCIAQGVPIPGGTVTLPAVVSRLSVNANSEYLEDALEFVSYITSGVYRKTSEAGGSELPIYDDVAFVLSSERMRPAYETYMSGGQIPIEDMRLNFTYWDTVRELCIKMFDGMTAQEAAEEYNRIQAEQLAAYTG